MSMMRAQFQRHLFPGLSLVMMNGFKAKPAQYSQLFRVEKSDSAFEEARTMAGLKLFGRIPEGISAPQDRFEDGFPKRWNHEDFGLAIGMSYQFMRDIKTLRLLNERSMDIGRSALATQEETFATMLNRGFDSTFPIPDGKALFATDHPNIRGGVQSNIIDPVSTVNVVGARLMLTKSRRFYDATGVRRINMDLKWAVVAPEQEFEALEVFKSTDRPDTANRATNVIHNRLQVFVYDYLTDTNNWFGMSDKDQHKLLVWFRDRFSTREYEEEKIRMQWMEGNYASSFGAADWPGVIGSNPA